MKCIALTCRVVRKNFDVHTPVGYPSNYSAFGGLLDVAKESSRKVKVKKQKGLPEVHLHPSHSSEIARLKRIKGQVEGVEKMILEKRYCPDIIVQIRAVRAALLSLEGSVLKTHLRHCVKDALQTKDTVKSEEKIQEIIELLAR